MRCAACLFIIFLAIPATASAEVFPLLESIRIEDPLYFCGERVPLENRDVRERLEKEFLLTFWDRPQVILWLKRSNRYFPVIEEMLSENGMPDDLKYITVTESALRPHIGSSKGAIGFWQFTRVTGKKYGLKIDRQKDERRNLIASTRAAIVMLKEFYETFESWTLAAAAFNMGKVGLHTQMFEQQIEDYYQLYLPLETQRYVLRIVAAKQVMMNPQEYGFDLNEEDLYRPLRYDRVTVECAEKIHLRLVAQVAGTSMKEIKDLNPEIRGYYLYKGSHILSVPEGVSSDFHLRFEEILKEWKTEKQPNIYVVKKGDNLSMIAERFRVPLRELLRWNKLGPRNAIFPGDQLIVYPNVKKTEK